MAFMRIGRVALAAAIGLGVAATRPAEAAFTYTVVEQGVDVVATGSGSLDTTALSFSLAAFGTGGVLGTWAFIGRSGPVAVYTGFTGPSTFGVGGGVTATSQSGDVVAINGFSGTIWVPQGYVSGFLLSSSLTFANSSFASLGLTPGTYTWNWGQDLTADSFTVQIGEAPVIGVPEPASALLFGAGLLGVAAVRRRRTARPG